MPRRKNNNVKKGQNKKKQVKDPIVEAKQARRKQKLMTKRQMANNVQFDQTTGTETTGIAIANGVMAFDVPISEVALSGLAASVVSFALSRGWQEYTPNPQDPVQAYRWIAKLLVAAAQNQIPQSATGPLWLAMVVQSLVQKIIPSRGGSVSYSGNIEVDDNYPGGLGAERDIGPPVYSRRMNFGVKTSTVVNGYFYTIDTNIPYDETEAQTAYTSLYNFLAKQIPGPMHKKVSLSDPNVMTNDASAFAVPWLKAGSGDGQTGGFYSTVSSEIPIRSPVFSCFRPQPGAPGDPGRAPNFTRSKGGDSFTLGGQLIQSLTPEQIHYKTPVHFKAVDFLEFGEVLASWVSKVQQAWVDDDNNAGKPGVDIQCPLTLQEFLLLLRANMMPTFAGTQHYGQSVYPRIPQSANTNEFVAFVSAMGTCAYNVPSMRMPRILKENIQACASRVNYGSRGEEAQPIFYVSVLGKYFQDVLSEKDFGYYTQGSEGELFVPSFKEAAFFDPKIKKKVALEDVISLIDGTTASEFVAINDPSPLGKLAVMWNNWVTKIKNYTTALTTNLNDGGVNALRVVGMTNHWYIPKEETKQDISPFYADREKKNILLRTSPYVGRRVEAITNQSKFIRGLWEGILSKFIKPVNLIDPAAVYGDQTGYVSNAAQTGELNTIVTGEGDAGGYYLSEIHELLASDMIKDKYGTPSEIEIELNALDAKGESGILSSLAGVLLGPGVGGIVDSLGLP